MPESTHTIELPFSVTQLWEIFNNVEDWAPFLESYVNHHIINDTESEWTFRGTKGLVKKKISTRVTIIEWNEPSRISLHVTGINEKFSGQGYIETKESDGGKSIVTIHHDITLKGKLKVMTSALSKPPKNKTNKKIVEDVTEKLRKAEKLLR